MSNILEIFLFSQMSFLVGFLLGRTSSNDRSAENQNMFKAQSIRKAEHVTEKLASVKIDDTKFVTNVTAEKFVKVGQELGKSSSVEDDIGSSVSKLAQLKQRK